jgi:hypothetical protein
MDAETPCRGAGEGRSDRDGAPAGLPRQQQPEGELSEANPLQKLLEAGARDKAAHRRKPRSGQ